MKAVIFIIDMQNYFLREQPDIFRKKLLPNIANLLSAARIGDLEVIHVITRYSCNKSDWPEAWKEQDSIWCLQGSGDEQIIKEVEPLPDEPLIVKTRYSAFYRTPLEDLLRFLQVDTIVLAGYSSDVCVRLTAMDAYNRGYHLIVLSDCVHSAHEKPSSALSYLSRLTNAQVFTCEEFQSAFSRG